MFQVGQNLIGSGRCFVIAEAGVNHNGDPELAHSLVEAAYTAGADAVKFQTFEPHLLVARGAAKADYQVRSDDPDESQLDMLRRLTLSHEVFAELLRHASQLGILFLSTAFDEPSADFLQALGMAAFKVPSGELTNHAFVAHLARKGRPLLISTGMSDMSEVSACVDVVRSSSGNPPLALLHCVSSYPADPTECNLKAMATLERTFEVPVGWSDHTDGTDIGVAAVALEAAIVEKHLTLDRSLPGPDHLASLEPSEFGRLVGSIRAVSSALGDGVKRASASELRTAAVARRSLHAARSMAAGHVILETDIVALRPGEGIPPSEGHRIVGRTLRSSVARGEMIHEGNLV